MTEVPKTDQTDRNKYKFVPLWISVLTFTLIVLAYLYCTATGIQVNEYRAIGAIGISGIITAVCAYLNYK